MVAQNKKLLSHARKMRNEPTVFEFRLWAKLSNSQLGGFKFRRQYVVDNQAIGDFFCPQKGLIIEIDGDTHDPEHDMDRDAKMRKMGLQTLRFTNGDVGTNIDGVLEAILLKLESLPDRWPHPSVPSPKGEGRFMS